MPNRRAFLRLAAVAAASEALLPGAAARSIRIEASGEGSFRRTVGERELLRGLTRLRPGAPGLTFQLRIEREPFRDAEANAITREVASASWAVTLA